MIVCFIQPAADGVSSSTKDAIGPSGDAAESPDTDEPGPASDSILDERFEENVRLMIENDTVPPQFYYDSSDGEGSGNSDLENYARVAPGNCFFTIINFVSVSLLKSNELIPLHRAPTNAHSKFPRGGSYPATKLSPTQPTSTR